MSPPQNGAGIGPGYNAKVNRDDTTGPGQYQRYQRVGLLQSAPVRVVRPGPVVNLRVEDKVKVQEVLDEPPHRHSKFRKEREI